MEKLLLDNLAKNQVFDAAMRQGKGVDVIAAQYVATVMYEPNAAKRAKAIANLQEAIVDYFAHAVQPAARKLGIANAKKVLEGLPAGVRQDGLNNSTLRRTILTESKIRPATRLRIVQALVHDQANTLENRLLAYWLEPGTDDKAKLERLRQVHAEMDMRQKKYNQKLSDFLAGKGSRPAKPNLDYLARFKNDAKQSLREQGRRAGTDAETEHFVQQGQATLTWVTVNASEACPDCRARQGKTLPISEWDSFGRPGGGQTVCGASCFCMLVPSKAVESSPSLQRGLEVPKREPEEAKPQITPLPEFPDDPAAVKPIRRLGGSTGAQLVEDEHGRRFVLKRGSSAGHLREEYAAEEAYRAAGVAVPPSRLYETPNGPAKLSRFMDGKMLNELPLNGPAYKAAVAKVKDGYAADALLANWDVAGLDLDNVLVGEDGQVYRIDTGGALRYRAQGKPKGTLWDQYPHELWTLQDAKINPASGKLFGDLGHDEKMGQIKALLSRREAILAAVPDDLRPTLAARMDEMKHLVDTNDTLAGDRWSQPHREQFNRAQLVLRSSSVVEAMPAKLQAGRDKVMVKDENGDPFDHLRGKGGLGERLWNTVDADGGSSEFLRNYNNEQGVNSWRSSPQALKYHLASQRELPASVFFWKDGHAVAKGHYDQAIAIMARKKKITTEEARAMYARTFAYQHAFTYELLRKTDMPNNNRQRRLVNLVRTEDREVMRRYGLSRGQKGVTMPRGVAESASIFRTSSVHGSESTVQWVPHHRVLATYLQSPGDAPQGMFLGDGENEFVAMLDGVPFDYELRRE